jgi:hypothetical protein
MSENTEHREQGVDFGALWDALDAHEYPATADELVAEYGEYVLDLPGGEERFADVFADYEDEFQDADDVRTAVLTMVDDEAVGRQRYSDRGGNIPGDEDEPGSDESF